ncbi:MAG: response regulator transcription factor [Cellvibrionaceae bacterium]
MIAAPTIIIADDHPLFRTALRGTLESKLQGASLLEASDFDSLQKSLEENSNANLLLLDLQMPGAEGFSTLVFTTAHYPQIPVMIVSAHEEPDIIRRAIDHGASGFLPKSAPMQDMETALQTVLEGNIWVPANLPQKPYVEKEELTVAEALANLTPQQFRVATMVNQGLLNKQIAYELNVTEATIKAHMTEIFKKLGVQSRTQVALVLDRLNINTPSNTDSFKK